MGKDDKKNTKLLIASEKAEEAMRLVNIFHDAGQTTRANHITSIDTLEQAFLERGKWDLLIISKLPEGVDLSAILGTIEQRDTDIPIIIIADYKSSSERMEYLEMGISAVISSDNEGMLLLKANTEINNMHMRRRYRQMILWLNESERQRRYLLDDEIDPIVYVRDCIIRYANPAFAKLIEKDDPQSLVGDVFSSLVKESEDDFVSSSLRNSEESGQAIAVLQFSFILDHDKEKPVRAMIKPTSYDGELILSLEILYNDLDDVDKIVVAEIEKSKPEGFLEKKAFLGYLDVDVQKVASGNGVFTLLYMSIDSFQEINEDICIVIEKDIESQIKKVIGVEYIGVALGRGKFALLINEEVSPIQDLTEKMFENIKQVSIGDKDENISLSMGAITLGDRCYDSKTLMDKAKHACSKSEKEPSGNLTYYKERKIGVVKSVDKYIAIMLGQAIKDNGLKLYYQPVVSLKGSVGQYHFYEASLAMTDKRGREHQAKNFRTKLDNKSLWTNVDRWQFCEVSRALLEKRKDGTDTRAFIHVGGCALNDEKFVPWLTAAVKNSGLPTSALILQISEANVCRYSKIVPAFFDAIKANGFHTSISEFGCSVNPLETLESINVDFISIDPSFTQDLTTEGNGDEFKKILIGVAKEGRMIIVPDVKNTAALAKLWHSGVDYVQGQFLQKPGVSMNYKFENDF